MKAVTEFIQSTKEIGRCDLHISNGGLVVAINENDVGEAILHIRATHFGQLTNMIEVSITRERLQELARIFTEAAKYPFKQDSQFGGHKF